MVPGRKGWKMGGLSLITPNVSFAKCFCFSPLDFIFVGLKVLLAKDRMLYFPERYNNIPSRWKLRRPPGHFGLLNH